jgi:aspartate aminotransferase-like enzyme
MTQQKTQLNLRIPGPTPVPEDILAAVAHPMVNHRGREFAAVVQRASERLKDFFVTKQDVMILSCSGTGGLEAAVVNTLSPGDKVLAVTIGAFGERLATIAEAYGAEVTALPYEWGQAAHADDIRKALKADPDIKAVLITHNETSTGVTNPLAQIAEVVSEFDKLLVVDAVSSLGAIPFEMDSWGIDCAVTGSQKGWMVPPGLAFACLSERGWQAHAQARMPRFYFDLAKHRDAQAKGQTPFTPAMPIFFGLDIALERMALEGMEAIITRHRKAGALTREGVKRLGLELLCQDEHFASDTVTAVKCPEGIDVGKLRTLLEDEYNLVLAGGQGKLSGKIFRIGHLGLVNENDIRETLGALGEALKTLGHKS